MTIPLFKSHYSLGRSILTLSNEDNGDKVAPDSIIDICKKNKLKEFFLEYLSNRYLIDKKLYKKHFSMYNSDHE